MKCKILSLLLILTFTYGKAQVTIGSYLPPNEGTLLDLKKKAPDANNANASKGLGMPRVNLVNPGSMDGVLNSANQQDKDVHIGLIVYNLAKVNGLCKGLHAWSGEEWIPLRKNECYSVEVNPELLTFGKTPAAAQNVTVTGYPANPTAVSFTNLGGGITSWANFPTGTPPQSQYAFRPPANATGTELTNTVKVNYVVAGQTLTKNITIKQLANDLLFQGITSLYPHRRKSNIRGKFRCSMVDYI